MILFFIFVAIIYFVDIILVGASFAAIKKAFNLNISVVKSILILIVVFGVLDNLFTPFFDYLDLTFTIHNQEIANFFGLKENTPASMFFSIGYFDFFIWLVESLIALFVVDKRITKKINAN
jgi:hypothetical protein